MSPTTWFSPRGARRGLLLAACVAALWCSWALGYLQGMTPAVETVRQPSHTVTVNPACCTPALKT